MSKSLVVGVMTVITALTSFLLPQLTGKTVITRMQSAVIILGAAGVAASTVKALLTDISAPVGAGDPVAPHDALVFERSNS